MSRKKPVPASSQFALDVDAFGLAMNRAQALNRLAAGLITCQEDVIDVWPGESVDFLNDVAELIEEANEKFAAAKAIVQDAWKDGE